MASDEIAVNSLDTTFAQLAEPFDPSEIKWRVTHANRDGSRGAVIAFADPRAYTDRLNQLFTPTGWTRTYQVSTVSSVTRMKREQLIQTGKVLVTCTLTIIGLGCHTGSGEEWADEENAMTAAEAQSFKRAASCFGLGRYLYSLTEVWVPLNEHRQPLEFPMLPEWALPRNGRLGKNPPAETNESSLGQRGPLDQKTTVKIENLRRTLGEPIYREILRRVAHANRATEIPNARTQAQVADAMERASRGIHKAHSLSESVGDTQFVSVLDRLQIASIRAIPSLAALRRLVSELEAVPGHPAA